MKFRRSVSIADESVLQARILELRTQSVSEITLIRTVRAEFALSLDEAKRQILEADGFDPAAVERDAWMALEDLDSPDEAKGRP